MTMVEAVQGAEWCSQQLARTLTTGPPAFTVAVSLADAMTAVVFASRHAMLDHQSCITA